MREFMNIVTESTGAECAFYEVQPGEWWYFLEHRWQGDGEERWGDWMNDAQAYGPFASQEEGAEHLRQNHANPGGYSVTEYQEGFQPDAQMINRMAEGKKRDEQERQSPYSRYGRWGRF